MIRTQNSSGRTRGTDHMTMAALPGPSRTPVCSAAHTGGYTSVRNQAIVRRVMRMDEGEGYVLSGKTGWARQDLRKLGALP